MASFMQHMLYVPVAMALGAALWHWREDMMVAYRHIHARMRVD